MKTIVIKCTKTIDEYIQINSNEWQQCYTYVKNSPQVDRYRTTFNKYAFIEFLQSIQIPKKFIKEVENYN